MKPIFVVVSLLYLDRVFGNSPPIITNYIEPQVVRIGFTLRFDCRVIHLGTSEVSWSFLRTEEESFRISVGTKIVIVPNDRGDGSKIFDVTETVNEEEGSKTYTLWLYRARPTETGTFRCQIEQSGNSNPPTIDATLSVLTPPQIQVSSSTIAKNTIKNSTIELVCSANGTPLPNVTWGRANGIPLPADRVRLVIKKTVSTVTKTLTLMYLKEEDRGTYRCSADNNVRPPDDLFTKVNVDFPPKVDYVEEHYGAVLGDSSDAIMWCKVAGAPSPDMTWYKLTQAESRAIDDAEDTSVVKVDDGFIRTHDAIQDDQAYSIEQKLVLIGSLSTMDSTFYTLIVHAVSGDEFGWYACSATNKYGSGYALIRLYRVNDIFTEGFNGADRQCTTPAAVLLSAVFLIRSSML